MERFMEAFRKDTHSQATGNAVQGCDNLVVMVNFVDGVDGNDREVRREIRDNILRQLEAKP